MTEQRLFSNQRLIRLIIPLVIEQALTILVGMCDGVMVSSVGVSPRRRCALCSPKI